MAHVDSLSRAPTEPSSDIMNEVIANRLEVLEIMTEENYVKSMQHSDLELRQIIDELAQGMPSKSTRSNYTLNKGILYRLVRIQKLTIIPVSSN